MGWLLLQLPVVRVHDQAGPDLAYELIPECDHFRKFISSVDVGKGKWNLARVEGLLR
jgi:hypothetical protein